MQLAAIQEALSRLNLDGWLFFDHHHRDPLAYRILGLSEEAHVSRRWFYLIRREGDPAGLVHRIEPHHLKSLPGEVRKYSGWRELQASMAWLLGGMKRVAMQYSPKCNVPYVSLVDGGTLESVRAHGVEIVSSGDLVQEFESRWSEAQIASHFEAGKLIDAIRGEAIELIRQRLSGDVATECEVQDFILRRFREENLFTDHGPIVAVNAHAGDPHYAPNRAQDTRIQRGDLVLIDLWAKLQRPGAVYYDITWTGFCGDVVPEKIQNVFEVVTGARDAAVAKVRQARQSGAALQGYEVDDAARGFIQQAGFGEYFIHRTGHSIGEDVHGSGANMDNLETHEDRSVITGTCFSVEPGVYLPEFGIRSEVNVLVGERDAQVTGQIQSQMLRLQ